MKVNKKVYKMTHRFEMPIIIENESENDSNSIINSFQVISNPRSSSSMNKNKWSISGHSSG